MKNKRWQNIINSVRDDQPFSWYCACWLTVTLSKPTGVSLLCYAKLCCSVMLCPVKCMPRQRPVCLIFAWLTLPVKDTSASLSIPSSWILSLSDLELPRDLFMLRKYCPHLCRPASFFSLFSLARLFWNQTWGRKRRHCKFGTRFWWFIINREI